MELREVCNDFNRSTKSDLTRLSVEKELGQRCRVPNLSLRLPWEVEYVNNKTRDNFFKYKAGAVVTASSLFLQAFSILVSVSVSCSEVRPGLGLADRKPLHLHPA